MTGSVYAVFDKSVHMYRGTTMAGIIRDEARHDPSPSFMGGYEMETLSLGLPFMAAFLNPGAWGRPFTAATRAPRPNGVSLPWTRTSSAKSPARAARRPTRKARPTSSTPKKPAAPARKAGEAVSRDRSPHG